MTYNPEKKHVILVDLPMGPVNVTFSWMDSDEARHYVIYNANRGGIAFSPMGRNKDLCLAAIESAVNADFPLPNSDAEFDTLPGEGERAESVSCGVIA